MAGLLLRVVIGAWHVHHEWPVSAPSEVERGATALTSLPDPDGSSPTDPARPHDCGICFTLSLAGMAGAPSDHSLGSVPPSGRIVLVGEVDTLFAAPPTSSFRSRAPPSL